MVTSMPLLTVYVLDTYLPTCLLSACGGSQFSGSKPPGQALTVLGCGGWHTAKRALLGVSPHVVQHHAFSPRHTPDGRMGFWRSSRGTRTDGEGTRRLVRGEGGEWLVGVGLKPGLGPADSWGLSSGPRLNVPHWTPPPHSATQTTGFEPDSTSSAAWRARKPQGTPRTARVWPSCIHLIPLPPSPADSAKRISAGYSS